MIRNPAEQWSGDSDEYREAVAALNRLTDDEVNRAYAEVQKRRSKEFNQAKRDYWDSRP